MHRFPKTQRLVRATLDNKIAGAFVLFGALFIAKLPYIGLRALADNGRTAVDGGSYERALFGGLPSVWLQRLLGDGEYGGIERVSAYIHMSWFFFPAAITLVVLFRYRTEFASYAAWYLAAMYLAALCFAIVPMQPPWMADDSVTRVMGLQWGSEVSVDNNPVAALPSLHVALPLTLALWSFSRKHMVLGGVATAFSVVTALNVVFLGEHYVIDVLGASALAAGVYGMARMIERQAFRWTPAATPMGGVARAESGQNLVEFAFIMPLLILMIGAIIMVALGLHTRSNLQQAVREGARQAAVGKSLTDVRNLAAGNSGGTLDATDINWCLPSGSTGSVGDQIRVYVDDGNNGSEGYGYTIIPATGIFSAAGMSSFTVNMSPRATSRLEKSVSGIPACT
jgi:hypothetical protein